MNLDSNPRPARFDRETMMNARRFRAIIDPSGTPAATHEAIRVANRIRPAMVAPLISLLPAADRDNYRADRR